MYRTRRSNIAPSAVWDGADLGVAPQNFLFINYFNLANILIP